MPTRPDARPDDLEALIRASVLLDDERKAGLLRSLDLLTPQESATLASTLRHAEARFLESAADALATDTDALRELEQLLARHERSVRGAGETDDRAVEQGKIDAMFPDAA